jgi:hypothetical protein
MVTETYFTGQDALDALLPLGFEILRETDQIRVARGAMKFTLPQRNEYCNPNLNKILHDVVADLKERAINAGRARRDNKIPLMVVHRGEVYAVVADKSTQWQLQDLESGNRFSALKGMCQTYDPEPQEKIMEAPKLTVHPMPPEPAPADVGERVTPLRNPSSVEALARLTRQRLEALKVDYDIALVKITKLQEDYAATAVFLRSLGYEPEALIEPPALDAKRTVLASSSHGSGGPGSSGGKYSSPSNIPQEFKDRFRMAYIDAGQLSGYGYLGKIKGRLKAMGTDIPYADNALYKLVQEVRNGA